MLMKWSKVGLVLLPVLFISAALFHATPAHAITQDQACNQDFPYKAYCQIGYQEAGNSKNKAKTAAQFCTKTNLGNNADSKAIAACKTGYNAAQGGGTENNICSNMDFPYATFCQLGYSASTEDANKAKTASQFC